MAATIKDVLKAGGSATLSRVQQMMKEHEELRKEVRELQRRESELKARLQAEILHRQSITELARGLEEEMQRLRGISKKGGKSRSDLAPSEEVKQRIQKMQSEFDKLRAGAEKATQEARIDEKNRLLSGMGQLLDLLTRAIEMSEGDWREGLEAIESQFVMFLEEEVQIIGKVGDEMDPVLHKAVDQVDHPAFGKGFVVEVRRRGFQLDDGTVVRTAYVVVAK